MFRTRVVTAFFLFWLFFAAISLSSSPLPILFMMTLFIWIAGAEYAAMRWISIEEPEPQERMSPKLNREHLSLGFVYAAGLPLYFLGEEFLGANNNGGFITLAIWLGISTIGASGVFYRREKSLNIATHKYLNGLAGFIYLTLPALVFFKLSQIQISNAPQGIALYFAFASVFMGDTGAYIAGRFLGRTKLLPKVSPKKTIEGALGGLVASGLTGYGICAYFNLPVSPVLATFIAVMAGAAGQIGDLAESSIKRVANCKDSGKLLPGHGGILDRIDAVLFGAPISYLLFLSLGR